jgi:pimeloyl-ACP methyl ester carboxylesterase
MPLPTVIVPGYLASAQPYQEMENALIAKGFPAVTVPLRKRDWLPALGGRSVLHIIKALDAIAQRAMVDYSSNQINLVGHAAGGWISRIYLGETPYQVHQSDRHRIGPRPARGHVGALITLGTPHLSRERRIKKDLDFVNQTYPGAFYKDVRYTCIAGKAVIGTQSEWLTFNRYRTSGGNGLVWGDGVVPVSVAHLSGAKNVVLDKVFHSPRPQRLWYGSKSVVSEWSEWLL